MVLPIGGIAQPITNSGVIVSLDLDGNGSPEVQFSVSASRLREQPETWSVGLGVNPFRNSRILRPDSQRVAFELGEIVGSARVAITNVFPDPPRPPSFSYSIGLLSYSAVFLGEWVYEPHWDSTFRAEREVLIGMGFGMDDGLHYGWLYFSREVADEHTPFELVSFNVHPLPGESIGAGQAPPLPPIAANKIEDQIEFQWDSRWGDLILESSTNLWSGGPWQTLDHSAGGPVYCSDVEGLRFFRLRYP